MRQCIAIGGIGTSVGKTVVSAILTEALQADYWKPIQCGLPSDRSTVQALVSPFCHCHPEIYNLKFPVAPHQAATLEHIVLDPQALQLPQGDRPLVIEGVGGVMVPLNKNLLLSDVLMQWQCEWIIVVRPYLGSINHTLLTVSWLKMQKVPIKGLIFNGENTSSTKIILDYTQLPCLGVVPQGVVNKQWIQQQAMHFKQLL